MKVLFLILNIDVESSSTAPYASFSELSNLPDSEILLIDDSPLDNARAPFAEAQRNLSEKVQVITNRWKQGYGGNQKVAFRYAIEKGFDAVVLIPWQGEPSLQNVLPLLEELRRNTLTGAVLGRALKRPRGWALRAPALSTAISIVDYLQRKLLKINLPEWHSPYRAYRVKALENISFELNTADPHFDVEVLLQLLDQRWDIRDANLPNGVPIPWSSKGGLRYAKNSLKAFLKFFLQRFDLFFDIRFHPHLLKNTSNAERAARVYDDKTSDRSPHSFICENSSLFPSGTRVLDIGCSTGYICHYLAQKQHCVVTGIDLLPVGEVKVDGFSYMQVDLEKDYPSIGPLIEEKHIDVVLLLDVIEHLADPERFLLSLYQRWYTRPPRFYISTGNVAFIAVRIMLLLGFFNYGQKGILDITHKRLFSHRTFQNLVEQTGFLIVKRHFFPIPFGKLGLNPRTTRFLESLHLGLIRLFPSLFAYQIMFEAVPTSLPASLLTKAPKETA